MEVCNNVTTDSVADQRPENTRKVESRISELFESPASGNRLTSMEGIRGMAVFLVFLVHYYWLFKHLLAASPVSAAIGYSLANVGQAGVDVFFVLSGYLIYAAALKPNLSYGGFIKRRVERIYPTFLVILALYIVGSYLFPERSRIPLGFGPAAVYILQNIALLPGLFSIVPIITVAWSLSYEFAYYLFTPALAFLTGMREWSSHRRIILICGMAATYITASALNLISHPRMVVFAGGMLLYEMTRGRPERRRLRPFNELLATIIFVGSLILGGLLFDSEFIMMATNGSVKQAARALILGAGSTVFIFYAIHFNGVLHRVFSWAPLRYWGNISYSYYLFHGLILHAIQSLVPNTASVLMYWAMFSIALAVTILGSAALYLAVERPLSFKRLSAPAATSAAA